MKTIPIVALFLALGTFVMVPALMAEEMAAQTVTESTPSTDRLEGVISAVDIESDVLSLTLIAPDGVESTVLIDEAETLVTGAGVDSDIFALTEGQTVSVRKIDRDGETVAKTIDILA